MNEFRTTIKRCELRACCGRPFLRIEKLLSWLRAHAGDLLEITYQQEGSDPELPITKEELCSKNSALLVFSILLELGRGEYVNIFDRKGLTDRLPIDMRTLEYELGDSEIPKTTVESLCAGFNEIQWRYCSPRFEFRRRREYLANHVVPILRKEAINTKGGTAKVWQIQVLEEFIEPDLRTVIQSSKFRGASTDPSDTLGWVKLLALLLDTCTHYQTELQFCFESV
jgi:hypothetical protein